jgi:hypothetical protein
VITNRAFDMPEHQHPVRHLLRHQSGMS